MQSMDYRDNIEGVSAVYLCKVCNTTFALMWEEEAKLGSERTAIEYTSRGIRRKLICDKCYQNNWKFTEHGVLINETPVKKKRKKKENDDTMRSL